ncbi:hypothetical protein NPIL_64231 [Nephila pilipes]|uniref:Uncharacterized protein n=1 Tax=Nephila pilipes TaxID=299642 RepID=A0A8X6PJI3_NEPPI|nr:hypothetical protein NPIL_64231 [Nephila pilipes]
MDIRNHRWPDHFVFVINISLTSREITASFRYILTIRKAPGKGNNFFMNIRWPLTFCSQKTSFCIQKTCDEEYFTFGGIRKRGSDGKDVLLESDLAQEWRTST